MIPYFKSKFFAVLVAWSSKTLAMFDLCVPTFFYRGFLSGSTVNDKDKQVIKRKNKALVIPEPAAWSSDRCRAGRGKAGSPPLSDCY